jgi:hypothetical protein
VNQLSHFEENLLTELREVVAERAAPGVSPGDDPLTVLPDDLEGRATGYQYFLVQYAVSGPVAPCVLVDVP